MLNTQFVGSFMDFFFKNELPTLNKIAAAVAQDENLSKLSRKLLLRTMHEMNFHHLKRNRKSLLIEKNEIVLWRRSYLEKLKQFRNSNRKIYYLDETWVNEGHTVTKVWQDCNIQTRRQAFLEGFSPGYMYSDKRSHLCVACYSYAPLIQNTTKPYFGKLLTFHHVCFDRILSLAGKKKAVKILQRLFCV
ncbi:hypothetical protein NQ317_005240 [Molorchus minor]|uniref:Transposase n=1 Tax=Molorchus minor TaxID=1323400 RepID=A0ABQ9JGW2_9CUCU|nr:hypothetical protein NQ317_005240 [Molorchus minor]